MAEQRTRDGTTESNREIVRAYLAGVAEDREGAIDRYMAPDVDYVVISDRSPELKAILPWIGRWRGRQAVKEYLAWMTANQTVEAIEVERMIADGDTVVVFATVTARALGTGARASWELVFRFRVEEGLITAYHLHENSFEAARVHRNGGAWLVANDGSERLVPEKPNLERSAS